MVRGSRSRGQSYHPRVLAESGIGSGVEDDDMGDLLQTAPWVLNNDRTESGHAHHGNQALQGLSSESADLEEEVEHGEDMNDDDGLDGDWPRNPLRCPQREKLVQDRDGRARILQLCVLLESPTASLLDSAALKDQVAGVFNVASQFVLSLVADEKVCEIKTQQGPTVGDAVDFSLARRLFTAINAEHVQCLGLHMVTMEILSSALDDIVGSIKQCQVTDVSFIFLLVLVTNRMLAELEAHELVMSKFCGALAMLSGDTRACDRFVALVQQRSSSDIVEMVVVIQHFITMRIYDLGTRQPISNDLWVTTAVQSLGLLFRAVVCSKTGDSRIPIKEFYNDAINEHMNPKDDLERWRDHHCLFAFCDYPCVLGPSIKGELMKLENKTQMNQELIGAFFRSVFSVAPNKGYLELKVRRQFLIQDALAQLMRTSEEFKKKLKVEFDGEEAVDEGGVQKEFFQLVVRKIFDPDYGMFTYDSAERTTWFNIHHLEGTTEYQLIGIVIGLAIYNSVILDLHFPLALYKKLMKNKMTLKDLASVYPRTAKGLQELLDYEGDVQEDFCLTFQAVTSAFGNSQFHDLIEDGGNISVTKENRRLYVDLYVDYFLNSSIEKEFAAFKMGFDRVAGGKILDLLHAEELEQLICGSPFIDFEELRQVASYDGYTATSRVIVWFWEVALALSQADQKRLLFFTTGSDRIPIGGMKAMTFIVAKNGGDSVRLPTAHTCFNVLMLCEYNSKERLEERIKTALENAEGFGLL